MAKIVRDLWVVVACICSIVAALSVLGALLLPQVASSFIGAGIGIILSQVIIATALPIIYRRG